MTSECGPDPTLSTTSRERDQPWLTVITPSYEQREFLDDCINSVPSDAGVGVEHVVVDGGSEDGTVDLLERASESRCLRWVSEPDEGHHDAVNKGLRMARGEWIGIQNSDDYYLDGAISGLRRAMERHPGQDGYFANVLRVDARGRSLQTLYCSRPSPFVHRFRGLTIRHQSLFIRRDVAVEIGGWDGRYYLALDYEWIGRLVRSDAALRHVPETWAAFRVQPEAKSEVATEDQWRDDLDAVMDGSRYPGGALTRPLFRSVAAVAQWTYIVADNGAAALVDRLTEKLSAGGGGLRVVPGDGAE